jgi:hypothetical protein
MPARKRVDDRVEHDDVDPLLRRQNRALGAQDNPFLHLSQRVRRR